MRVKVLLFKKWLINRRARTVIVVGLISAWLNFSIGGFNLLDLIREWDIWRCVSGSFSIAVGVWLAVLQWRFFDVVESDAKIEAMREVRQHFSEWFDVKELS